MERVDDRQEKVEKYFSTGQSPRQAVAPTEEEEQEEARAPQWAKASSLSMIHDHTQTHHTR